MSDSIDRIICLTNTDAEFYPLVGPFLSNRAVVRELGFPVWDDPGKTWFVAVDAVGKVLGFAAVRLDGGRGILCSAYVCPESRGKHVHDRLTEERVAFLAGKATVATATATPAAAGAFRRRGFVGKEKARSKFVVWEKSL